MKPQDTARAAHDMGISIEAAFAMRIRYLLEEIDAWLEIDDEVSHVYAFQCLDEIVAIKGYKAKPKYQNQDGHLTVSQIEAARNADIRSLVGFDRQGKATAPCHEDKRPSLVFLSRTGKAWCPVCDRKFNAVDWLMEVEGLTFPEAVRRLAA
ncbi:CHC2 zinc finger domain-containing protein [Geobacter benzoatilyticus]|uniref:Zinc finger CHC2-type domain-containing protein n=1 Tax=Geobacter benzoatilyticus TaxID=2815309 RepID=A0ABX7Q403_9BACT|nr:CHC2 zinc finger domain-containing protein [Geobacter benzoatilyticus]QSV46167.1 hypothetical protein JZM60_02465 [Geobacter benzoatilyticus]